MVAMPVKVNITVFLDMRKRPSVSAADPAIPRPRLARMSDQGASSHRSCPKELFAVTWSLWSTIRK